jgi:hypothetical protein
MPAANFVPRISSADRYLMVLSLGIRPLAGRGGVTRVGADRRRWCSASGVVSSWCCARCCATATGGATNAGPCAARCSASPTTQVTFHGGGQRSCRGHFEKACGVSGSTLGAARLVGLWQERFVEAETNLRALLSTNRGLRPAWPVCWRDRVGHGCAETCRAVLWQDPPRGAGFAARPRASVSEAAPGCQHRR